MGGHRHQRGASSHCTAHHAGRVIPMSEDTAVERLKAHFEKYWSHTPCPLCGASGRQLHPLSEDHTVLAILASYFPPHTTAPTWQAAVWGLKGVLLTCPTCHGGQLVALHDEFLRSLGFDWERPAEPHLEQ